MGTFFSSLGCLRQTTGTPTGHPNNSTSPSRPTEVTHDLHPEPASVARYTGRTSPLFALIIGIDTYVGMPLHGAVADAKEMKRYLQETLGVSEEYIRILLDDQATRNEIIDAFRDIRNDRRIQSGDPILIFYAGHGTELYAPKAWGPKKKIQGILPHDDKQRRTYPIPDLTIGALIEDIAREKGNNITVIFDCCYAAGGTRADKEYIPRRAEHIDPNILLNVDDLDQEVITGRHGEALKGFGTHGVESHVLLAACRTTELAFEHRGRGLFTSELLKILRGSAVNHLTYAEVISRIRLDRQHPSCQSVHERRVLFDERVTDDGPVRYPITVDHNNLVVGAGKAHGVSHGVKFTLYSGRGQRLCMIKVDHSATIEDFKTIVRQDTPRLGNAPFAKLTRVGKISIYVAPERKSSLRLDQNLRRMCQSSDANFQLVEDPREAKLEVAMENGRVFFRILDQRTRRFGLTRLPSTVTATVEAVHHVLSAAAHYYWYLHHTSGSVHTNHKVDVNFYELESELDDDRLLHRFPIGEGLCQKDPVDNSDVISFVVAREKEYGIEIRNNTGRDLYVNAFLFNGSSLRIAPYRIQSIVGISEAPLKQNGMLTIGYGDGGNSPFTYWVGGGQSVDVGYLKLFFATRPIDLSSIIQGSPFQPVESQSSPVGDAREGGAVVTDERELEDMWFTKVIPIVQRRA